MSKLIKYLKPFSWAIIAMFALLFGQAMAELALPNYMADIVDIGIQQNGIENAVPIAIRAADYEKLAYFMTEDQQSLVMANYRYLSQDDLSESEYTEYLKDYPILAEEPVYELATENDETIQELNGIFGPAITIVSAITSGTTSGEGGTSTLPGLPALPEGEDPFLYLATLSPSQLDMLRQQMGSQLGQLPDTLIMQSAIPYLTAEYEAIGIDIAGIQLGYMLPIGGLMLVITLGGASAAIVVGFLASRVSSALGRNLRLRIFRRVESFSNAEFDKFSTASLITRTTNDIQQIQNLLVMLFRIVFFAPIMGIGGFIYVLTSEASMWWVIAVAVGAMLIMIATLMSVAVPRFRVIQKLVDRLNLVTREILSGLLVIRAFNTQRHEEQKFDKANVDLTKINLFITRMMIIMQPTMMLIMNGAMILTIWVGAIKIDAGGMQVGDMMAFMQYAMLIIQSFLMISIIFIMLPRAIVSINRINEVLVTEPEIVDPVTPAEFPENIRGLIEFKDVYFRYPAAEEDMLKDISFTARPGETTAIIGSTGSGKSTLINLIPRFYDVTAGQILIDGVDVREVYQHDLREKIGYVPQKSALFSGTIGSNLRYADETATEALLEQSIVSAQAQDFIKSAEGGLDAPVSQGAANLSGGQKQRLSIARALVKQPEVYIFDDSFSALDFKTDAAVRRALKQDTKQATVIIVTQRLSTIMGSEQIIVLDRGEIVGTGKHDELMKTCEVYREIAQSQLSEEELGS